MTSPTPLTDRPAVTVLGLGAMGTSLAQALLRAGTAVTTWNRTPARASALVAAGAAHAPDPGAAVAAADLVLICLRDHEAVRQVLSRVAPRLQPGTDVVNLTSATPQQARETAVGAARQQVSYLSGAIMVPTPMIGSPEALVFYSGPVEIYDRQLDNLHALAGQAVHLGPDHGQAAVYEMALLDMFFAGMTSFLHAGALVQAHGVSASTFLPYAEGILDVLHGSLGGLARDVDAAHYPGTEDTLAMERDALAHIVETSRQSGVDPAFPATMLDYANRAVDAGHGADGYSRLVELFTAERTAAA